MVSGEIGMNPDETTMISHWQEFRRPGKQTSNLLALISCMPPTEKHGLKTLKKRAEHLVYLINHTSGDSKVRSRQHCPAESR